MTQGLSSSGIKYNAYITFLVQRPGQSLNYKNWEIQWDNALTADSLDKLIEEIQCMDWLPEELLSQIGEANEISHTCDYLEHCDRIDEDIDEIFRQEISNDKVKYVIIFYKTIWTSSPLFEAK